MNIPSEFETVSRSSEIFKGQQEFLFPCVGHLYQEPLVLVKGAGTAVWDAEGKEYLDFFSGILSTSQGHCHPRISEAISKQAETLGHTDGVWFDATLLKCKEVPAPADPALDFVQHQECAPLGTECT